MAGVVEREKIELGKMEETIAEMKETLEAKDRRLQNLEKR